VRRSLLKPPSLIFGPVMVLLLAGVACGTSATPPSAEQPIPTSSPRSSPPSATPVPASEPTAPAATMGDKLTVALSSFDNEEIAPHISGKVSGMALATNYADYLIGTTVDNQLTNEWGLAE